MFGKILFAFVLTFTVRPRFTLLSPFIYRISAIVTKMRSKSRPREALRVKVSIKKVVFRKRGTVNLDTVLGTFDVSVCLLLALCERHMVVKVAAYVCIILVRVSQAVHVCVTMVDPLPVRIVVIVK